MIDYNNVLKEKDQEKRIEIILTDAYGEDEQDWAFCTYLEDYITFPFKAKIRGEKKSDIFTVIRFTSLEPNRVVCEIKINGKKSRMPLTEIEPVDKENTNNIVIGDFINYLGI